MELCAIIHQTGIAQHSLSCKGPNFKLLPFSQCQKLPQETCLRLGNLFFPNRNHKKPNFLFFFRKLFDFRFCATCVLFQSFGVRMLAKVQQRLNSQSRRLSKDSLQTSVGKLLTIHRKKSKMSKYLSISDIFFELSFQIGNFCETKPSKSSR